MSAPVLTLFNPLNTHIQTPALPRKLPSINSFPKIAPRGHHDLPIVIRSLCSQTGRSPKLQRKLSRTPWYMHPDPALQSESQGPNWWATAQAQPSSLFPWAWAWAWLCLVSINLLIKVLRTDRRTHVPYVYGCMNFSQIITPMNQGLRSMTTCPQLIQKTPSAYTMLQDSFLFIAKNGSRKIWMSRQNGKTNMGLSACSSVGRGGWLQALREVWTC